jgi:hypothetical protein
MSVSPIPIENIYYLFCYAWNRFEEAQRIPVASVDWTCPDKVESFLPMKGELDEQAEGLYAGV